MARKEKIRTPERKAPPSTEQLRLEALSMPPDRALNRILDAPDPAALIRSFAEEDFFFVVHGIGPEDSLPLLADATPRQWEYLLDMELWQRDRFDTASAERWLRLLEKAAAPRLARWLMDSKQDLMALFLNRTVEVRVREHDQDPSVFGDDFFTVDDTYYVRVPKPEEVSAGKMERHEDRETLVTRLLARIAEVDHLHYQKMLLDAAGLLPAEAEEEAYRMRNVRLAEKGFAPADEAVGVYQRLTPEALAQKSRKYLLREPDRASKLPVPRFAEGLLDDANLFARSLSAVDSSAALLQLQQEFAGLCNRIIAADQMLIRQREALRTVVEKAAGYLSIALEQLTADNAGDPEAFAARLLETYPLIELFRVGHGLALELKWKAGDWHRQSWAQQEARLPLSFWDEQWVGVLGGLLLPRPRYFDNYRTQGDMYRDFADLTDIRRTAQLLAQIIETDRLLSLMQIDTSGARPQGLTYKNFLLTLWAGEETGLFDPEKPAPLVPSLTMDAASVFHRRLFPGGASGDPSRVSRVSDAMKEAFARFLSRRTGLDEADIVGRIEPTLAALFAELEEELGAVSTAALDPRFIRLFLVAKNEDLSG